MTGKGEIPLAIDTANPLTYQLSHLCMRETAGSPPFAALPNSIGAFKFYSLLCGQPQMSSLRYSCGTSNPLKSSDMPTITVV